MKPPFLTPLCLILAVLMLWGCKSVAPGQDPVVVNAERAETIAMSTFDLVLETDNQNRPFWRTNAPQFHAFAEWLRQPQAVGGTNYPRATAMILDLDFTKRDYKVNKISATQLQLVVSTVQDAITRAGGWLTVATNSVH